MKRQIYFSCTITLLLANFSALALDETPSGLIAIPRQPQKNNNWSFATGFACTAAVGGAAAFAVYKMQNPNLQFRQKCTIPVLASALAAACCNYYAESRANDIWNKFSSAQISALANKPSYGFYTGQKEQLEKDITDLENRITWVQRESTPDALARRHAKHQEVITGYEQAIQRLEAAFAAQDQQNTDLNNNLRNELDDKKLNLNIVQENLKNLTPEAQEAVIRSLKEELAGKQAQLDSANEGLSRADQAGLQEPSRIERNTSLQPFRKLALGAMFGTAVVACASACYHFFKK